MQHRDDFPLFAVYRGETAGSRWLATALSLHAGVLAAHTPLFRFRVISAGRSLDLKPVELLRMVHALAFGRRAAGVLGSVTLDDDETLRAAFGERFSRAVLTRHPVRRADSMLHIAQRAGLAERAGGGFPPCCLR